MCTPASVATQWKERSASAQASSALASHCFSHANFFSTASTSLDVAVCTSTQATWVSPSAINPIP